MALVPSRFLPNPYFTASYFLGRGGISDVSTGSNSNFGSSASGAKYAFVVFKKFLFVALRKIRLVMRPARFVAHARALRYHPRQLQHVIKLPREDHAGIRPLRNGHSDSLCRKRSSNSTSFASVCTDSCL